MTAEDAAWAALDDALQDYEPPCDGNPLFTADSLNEGERALCGMCCARCHVADLCEGYAKAANVKCGFWAGRQYGKNGRRKVPAVDAPQDASPTSTPASASRTPEDEQTGIEDET